MEGLRAAHLTAVLGRRRVLEDVSIGPLAAGSITALLGANGSGKTTLLRALAGLQRSSGRLTLGGPDPAARDLSALAAPERARFCAYMPQALPPPIRMTAIEAVEVSLRLRQTREERAREQAGSVLDELGIAALAGERLSALSGGQRQMVGLAQALVRRPAVLLLDEPLSALDPHHQFAVMAILRRETEARGIVTVMSVHDIGMALRCADHAVLLKRGHVIGDGPVEAVLTPAHLAAAFGIRARIGHAGGGERVVLVEGLCDTI